MNSVFTNHQTLSSLLRSINLILRYNTSRFTSSCTHHLITVTTFALTIYPQSFTHGIMKDLYDAGLRGRLPLFVQGFLLLLETVQYISFFNAFRHCLHYHALAVNTSGRQCFSSGWQTTSYHHLVLSNTANNTYILMYRAPLYSTVGNSAGL